MVYVDPKNLGYRPFWEKWCNARVNTNEQKVLLDLFEKYVPQCIDLVLDGIMDGRQGQKLKTIVPQTNLNMVRFLDFLAARALDSYRLISIEFTHISFFR